MIKHTSATGELRKAFYRVFKSRNAFSAAGREEFPVRVVLYPTYGYYLEANQFRALVSALHEYDEEKFFISMIEAEPEPRNWGQEFTHWECENPTLDEYMNLELFLENSIYSSSGSWGILVSHEDHALLVCQHPFWSIFEKYYPAWKQDLEQFNERWQRLKMEKGIDVEWLKPLLSHLKSTPTRD